MQVYKIFCRKFFVRNGDDFMIKEIAENIPLNLQVSAEEFQNLVTQDFVNLIGENCGIDLTKSAENLSSPEMSKIISTVAATYKKILDSKIANDNQKIFVANNFLCRLFDLMKISQTPELFFIKVREKFNPAQIVSALSFFAKSIDNFNWTTNFFINHKSLLPTKQKKIRTIGIYYHRYYSGGIEQYLSKIFPIYLQLGYRVIFLPMNTNLNLNIQFLNQEMKIYLSESISKLRRKICLPDLRSWKNICKNMTLI